MAGKQTPRYSPRVLRAILATVGGLFVFVSLIADFIGLSRPGNLGAGQILLAGAGLAGLVFALLGRERIVVLYQSTAIMLLNTLVLLACLELGVEFAIDVKNRLSDSREAQTVDRRAELPYYASQDWAETYWQEFTSIQTRRKKSDYRPWVVWRRPYFQGETININQDGLRRTPGADPNPNAYKVFTFGGSTMWGSGSPDWGTIAAYLQVGLESSRDEPVRVVNFGQSAYVSTQGVIELFVQLRSGNVPDMVIFYNGINDVIAAGESGQAGVHLNFDTVAARFEGQEHPLVEWLTSSRSFKSFAKLVARAQSEGPTTGSDGWVYQDRGIDADSLADSVVQIYLGNYRIVEALAQGYGFEYAAFWQPIISVGEKALTPEEQSIRDRMSPAAVSLFSATYQRIEIVAPEYENLYYIAHVFGGQDSQIWNDLYHVTPEGNQLVVQEMLDAVQLQLTAK